MADPRPSFALLSPNLPFPLHSGVSIRVSNIARCLQDLGDVHLLALTSAAQIDDFAQSPAGPGAWWGGYKTVHLQRMPRWRAFEPAWYRARLTWRIGPTAPLMFETFPAEPLRTPLAALASQVDLIWAGRLFLADRLQSYRRQMVVDIDDLESVKLQRSVDVGDHGASTRGLRREVSLLSRAERAASKTYRAAAVCSAADARLLGGESESVWTVPNGVDDRYFELLARDFDPLRMVFVGALDYAPNTEGIIHFCLKVLPAILDRCPGAKLDIVGRSPPPRVRALHNGAAVHVYADVPDVVPYVQRSALSVVPLLVGGGTRLKILESLALGTPVVSTTVGAEGIELVPGRDALIVESDAAMVEGVLRVLHDDALRTALSTAGRTCVRAQYGWAGIRQRLAIRLTREVEKRRCEQSTSTPHTAPRLRK